MSNNPAFRLPFEAQQTTANDQRLLSFPALIVPGLNDSDVNHWQSLWQRLLTDRGRIELCDWHVADLDKWRRGIELSLADINAPVILIAHSFGALAAASVAEDMPDKIAGLFLVAPADPDKFDIAHRLPENPLSIPSVLIISNNDPWMTDRKAARWALRWGSDFLTIKNLGHINSQSGIGHWPEGLTHYGRLVERVQRTRSSI